MNYKTHQAIGIIGSGMIGANVARLATAAGLKVVICNSRGPETLAELIAELGPNARAATLAEVAAATDLIVLAVPFFGYAKLPVDTLAGKIIMNTMNYYPQRDGEMPQVQTDTIATHGTGAAASARVPRGARHQQHGFRPPGNPRPPWQHGGSQCAADRRG